MAREGERGKDIGVRRDLKAAERDTTTGAGKRKVRVRATCQSCHAEQLSEGGKNKGKRLLTRRRKTLSDIHVWDS